MPRGAAAFVSESAAAAEKPGDAHRVQTRSRRKIIGFMFKCADAKQAQRRAKGESTDPSLRRTGLTMHRSADIPVRSNLGQIPGFESFPKRHVGSGVAADRNVRAPMLFRSYS